MQNNNSTAAHFDSDSIPARRKTLAIMVSAVLGTAPASLAVGSTLEEIIVTASKRKSGLQDLPQAITAFTTDDIARRGFDVLDDYANKIPSLAFARREPAGTSVVFRGVAASGIQFGTKPSAGIYLDEAPITQAGLNPDPRLVDIERVEALSGPQGTLFGDASQSGTLRIITNKADPTAPDGWIEGSAAHVKDSDDLDNEVSAMLNLPLVRDVVAVRLVGFRSEEAGYIDNVLTTNRPDRWRDNRIAAGLLPPGERFDNADQVEDDVNRTETTGGRASLRWFASEDWTVDLVGTVQNTDTDGFGDVNLDVGDRAQGRFENEELNDDWYQLSLSLEGRLGAADALLTGSYFSRDLSYQADATDYLHDFDQKYDPTYFNGEYYTVLYDFSGAPRGFAQQEEDTERWTAEGRLSTVADSGSRWSGVAGFFYSRLRRDSLFVSQVRDFSDTADGGNQGYYILNYLANSPEYNPNYASFHNAGSNNFFFGAYDQDVEQYALFGEATWEATDRLSFTAGARWFDFEQEFTLRQGALLEGDRINPQRDFLTNNETSNYSENDWVPRLNTTYRIADNALAYATFSEGFRSGGTNALRSRSILPRDYDSDILKNYEIGLKSEWLDNTLRFNTVAYYMQWDDMQIQVNDPTVFSLGIVNFSKADIRGFEAELSWLPAAGWKIDVNLALIDAQIAEDNIILSDSGEVIANVEKGAQLPITPEEKASVAVQYSFQQSWLGAEPYARLDWSYVGESVNSLAGTESIVFTRGPTTQPDYGMGDLRLGLDGSQWSADLYVENITDESADQFFNNRWGLRQRVSINKPRTTGIRLRWRF